MSVGHTEENVRDALLELRELELLKMNEKLKSNDYFLNPPAIRRWLSEEIDFQFVPQERPDSTVIAENLRKLALSI